MPITHLTTSYVKLGLLGFLSLLLLACAHQAPKPTVRVDAEQHQAGLAELTTWQIAGRFGFKGPEQKQSASLHWAQQGQNYQLTLSTILGTAILSMQNDNGLITAKADDKNYTGINASELIWQMTGWTIPVDQLPIWIKGQYTVNDQVVMNEQGFVSQLAPTCLTCQGWLISYSNYQVVENKWLPHKIVMTHSSRNVQVIIKVNAWTLNV
ncbi:MAG: outer membrane lipoprotein LolB [Paraglaciecola sp.]|nr:outer membrane lipoprotein LolB [Paraglaciecola sp.]NCT47688.1 outer membrane lipoprotein LolB [Paraglaciecola sp.]